jgi:hypothetical protein
LRFAHYYERKQLLKAVSGLGKQKYNENLNRLENDVDINRKGFTFYFLDFRRVEVKGIGTVGIQIILELHNYTVRKLKIHWHLYLSKYCTRYFYEVRELRI